MLVPLIKSFTDVKLEISHPFISNLDKLEHPLNALSKDLIFIFLDECISTFVKESMPLNIFFILISSNI